MKDAKVFVDTNILVYAYDVSAREKREKAMEVISGLWNTGRGVISTQVLQEFFVCVTKKIPEPLSIETAKSIVSDYLKWDTVVIGGDSIIEAIDICSAHKYSFWDSMVIASALRSGAKTILSEDFSDRQRIKGILIKNPFK